MLFVKFLFIFMLSILVYGNRDERKIIDIDYYGRGFLRHSRVEMNCELELHKQYCRFKCSKSYAVCIEGYCYCVKGNTTGLLPSRQLHEPEDFPPKGTNEDDTFLNGHPSNLNSEPKIPKSRPILRHHIAHFCPDLDEARKCIRKCMPQGKPAFCGKDHVCYCGHKYQTPGNKFKKANVSAQYAQFKDLYDKYFGKVEATEEVDENAEGSNEAIVDAPNQPEKTTSKPHADADETTESRSKEDKKSQETTKGTDSQQPSTDATIEEPSTTANIEETTLGANTDQTGEPPTGNRKLKKLILRHRFINI